MTFLIFLKNIIQLLLSPTRGWNDIAYQQNEIDKLTSKGLYPLMALMLVTVFVRPIYGIEKFDLVKLLQTAMIQFVALYVALYTSKLIMEKHIMKYNDTGLCDETAINNVAVYSTGLMTLIQIVENFIPVGLTIIQFLPAFAAVSIWKSAEYLEIKPEIEYKFMSLTLASLIIPVVAINILMSFLIN